MATVADRPTSGLRQAPRRGRRARLLASLAAATACLLAIAAVVVAIVLVSQSGTAPPATAAARLVPANALLYLNVSTDSARPSVRQAMDQVRRLSGAPLLTAAVSNRFDQILSGTSSNTLDFAADVRPWLGPEAAIAVLDTPGASAGTLIVLAVRDLRRARVFLTAQGAVPAGSYRRVELLHDASGTTFGFLGHDLVLGQQASVAAAIDVARGAASLAASGAFQAATAGEPADRVLDFYAPVAGVRRALVPSQGLLGALGTLLDQPALRAATVTVSPSADGFSVRVHSLLDPKLARAAGAKAPSFTPSLAAALPAGSEMVLDAPSLPGAVPKLFAAAAKVGIAGRVMTLLSKLGAALSAQGVNMHRFFSSFGRESALAIVPGIGGSAPAPVLVGRSGHPDGALNELASLEGPLTQAFTPPTGGGGVVPEVNATTVGGTTVSELTLGPGLQLDWGVSHGLVAVSTSPGVVAAVIRHRGSLAGEGAYKGTLGNSPSRLTTLVFLDLAPLLRLGSQTGLIGGSTLAALRPDLDQIRAIGLASTRGDSDTTTQLQLRIR